MPYLRLAEKYDRTFWLIWGVLTVLNSLYWGFVAWGLGRSPMATTQPFAWRDGGELAVVVLVVGVLLQALILPGAALARWILRIAIRSPGAARTADRRHGEF